VPGRLRDPTPPTATGKPRYSDVAREEGMVDVELVEAIERDIVEQVRGVCPHGPGRSVVVDSVG
jgi:hypothetical protein